MEHEVYVPFSVGSVREALADRGRVTRCVPGLQLAAAEGRGDAVEGRLRVRIGGSTITYRGELKITAQGDGFRVKGSGSEVRGTGSVRLALKVEPRLSTDGEGTRLVCSAKLTGDGRITEFEDKVVAGAGRRLLDRFAAALSESLQKQSRQQPDADGGAQQGSGETGSGQTGGAQTGGARAAAGIGEPDDNDRAIPGIPGPEKGGKDRDGAGKGAGQQDGPADAEPGGGAEAEPGAGAESDSGTDADTGSETGSGAGSGAETSAGGVFEAEIPPPSLDPLDADADADADDGVEIDDGVEVDDGGLDDAEVTAADDLAAAADGPTAEAAHARRTMIGRSAEEVDHAPPRGRYAPVPAADSAAAVATLRWAAPAAALALAGAVVLSRALRRRR